MLAITSQVRRELSQLREALEQDLGARGAGPGPQNSSSGTTIAAKHREDAED